MSFNQKNRIQQFRKNLTCSNTLNKRDLRNAEEVNIRKNERRMNNNHTIVEATSLKHATSFKNNGHKSQQPHSREGECKKEWPRSQLLAEKKTQNSIQRPPFIVPGVVHYNDRQVCVSYYKPVPSKNISSVLHPICLPNTNQVKPKMTTFPGQNQVSKIPIKKNIPSFAPRNYKFIPPKGISLIPVNHETPKYKTRKCSNIGQLITDSTKPYFCKKLPSCAEPGDHSEDTCSVSESHLQWLKIENQQQCIKKSERNLCAEFSSLSPPPSPPSTKNLTNTGFDKEAVCQLSYLTGSQLSQDVNHFRNLLHIEANRLKHYCTEWEEKLKTEVPIEEVGTVLSVIGQAQLLQRERFHQFAGLIEQFENQTSEKKIIRTDMEGFWDMILLQVDDINRKFNQIRALYNSGWVRQENNQTQKIKETKHSKSSKAGRTNGKESTIRNYIAAARERMVLRNARSPFKSPQRFGETLMSSPVPANNESLQSVRNIANEDDFEHKKKFIHVSETTLSNCRSFCDQW